MKWFDRWFANKCKQAWDDSKGRVLPARDYPVDMSANRATPISPISTSNGLTFNIYRANGGFIVEHRRYDIQTDHTVTGLHIITNDMDLGQELGKIITYESLKH